MPSQNPGRELGSQPPAAPANLRGTESTATTLTIAWNAATAGTNPVAAYRIYRQGAVLRTVDAKTLSFQDTMLSSNTSYSYTVRAVDTAGRESSDSNVLTLRTGMSPCHALRSAAIGEETALRRLRSAVIVNEAGGTIDGPGPDYTASYQAARSAVDTANQRLTEFQQAGGSLPVLGGGEVDYERDLGYLADFELTRVNDGVTRSAAYDQVADYNAWNQLKVYADNSHLVGTMQCS